MASQLALLFVRRLEVPVVLTDLDQARVDKGVGYVHAEVDKLLGKGRVSPDKANRLKAPGHRHRRQEPRPSPTPTSSSRRSSRRWRSRSRSSPTSRPWSRADVRAGHQHLVAVDHRDGRRPRAPRAGGRLPLLQPGRGDAAARDRHGRADRRRHAGHRVRDRQGAEEDQHPGQGQPVVHREPAARPLHGRGGPDRRRGHPAQRRRRRVRRGRPDAAVLPAVAGRSGHRAAQQRDAARGLPGPVPRLAEPARSSWPSGKGQRLPAGLLRRPGGRGDLRGAGRRYRARPRPTYAPGCWRRWPRRPG